MEYKAVCGCVVEAEIYMDGCCELCYYPEIGSVEIIVPCETHGG